MKKRTLKNQNENDLRKNVKSIFSREVNYDREQYSINNDNSDNKEKESNDTNGQALLIFNNVLNNEDTVETFFNNVDNSQ